MLNGYLYNLNKFQKQKVAQLLVSWVTASFLLLESEHAFIQSVNYFIYSHPPPCASNPCLLTSERAHVFDAAYRVLRIVTC